MHRPTASRQDDCCDGDAGRSHDGSHAEGLAAAAVESVQAWHVAVHLGLVMTAVMTASPIAPQPTGS